MEPVYSAKRILDKDMSFKLNQLDGQSFDYQYLKEWKYKDVNMRHLIYQIAENINLPFYQVFDTAHYYVTSEMGQFLGELDTKKTYADAIHTSDYGN